MKKCLEKFAEKSEKKDDYKKVYEEIKALKDVCGEIHLKTILHCHTSLQDLD